MISIERAEMKDNDALQRLYAQLEPDTAPQPERAEPALTAMLQDPRYHLLVARRSEDGAVLGTAMGIICANLVGGCDPFMVVENVVVEESCRGMGVGKLLMQEVERIATQEHCVFLCLLSHHSRHAAHAFYRGLGYSGDEAIGFRKWLKTLA